MRAGASHSRPTCVCQATAVKSLELSLGVSKEQAEALIKREPGLQDVPTIELSARVRKLQVLLHLGEEPAAAVATASAGTASSSGAQQQPQQPQQAARGADAGTGSSAAQAQVLGLRRAAQLASLQPRVLLVPQEEAQQRFSALADLLQV